MDLLGYLGKATNNTQPSDPASSRGAQGRQASSLLLARLPASARQRAEVVRETGAIATLDAEKKKPLRPFDLRGFLFEAWR
jgi:hypothetical protein